MMNGDKLDNNYNGMYLINLAAFYKRAASFVTKKILFVAYIFPYFIIVIKLLLCKKYMLYVFFTII